MGVRGQGAETGRLAASRGLMPKGWLCLHILMWHLQAEPAGRATPRQQPAHHHQPPPTQLTLAASGCSCGKHVARAKAM